MVQPLEFLAFVHEQANVFPETANCDQVSQAFNRSRTECVATLTAVASTSLCELRHRQAQQGACSVSTVRFGDVHAGHP